MSDEQPTYDEAYQAYLDAKEVLDRLASAPGAGALKPGQHMTIHVVTGQDLAQMNALENEVADAAEAVRAAAASEGRALPPGL